MRTGTRNLFLATTSAIALGAVAMSSGLAAERLVLEDGRTVVLKDDGSYEFVQKATEDAAKVGNVAPLAAETVVMPAAMTGKRTISGHAAVFAGIDISDHGTGSDGTDELWPLAGGTARIDLPFNIDSLATDSMSVQLDLIGESEFLSAGDTDTGQRGYTGQSVLGAHLNYRQMNEYLFGVFAAGGMAFVDDDTLSTSEHMDNKVVSAGIEGQLYFDDLLPGNLTAYGQVGWVHSWKHPSSSQLESGFRDGVFVRVVGRYFEDFGGAGGPSKGEIDLQYARGGTDHHDETGQMIGWNFEIEHPFYSYGPDDGYVSAFARYEGRYFLTSDSSGEEFPDNRFIVGIKLALNEMNLLDRDRAGATLDLPDLGRMTTGVWQTIDP